jgi:hypothetical protein
MANSREVGILEKRSWHPWNPHLCFCHSDLEFSIPGACHFSVGELLEIPSPDPDQTNSCAAAGPAVQSHARPVVVAACHSPSHRRRFALYLEARRTPEPRRARPILWCGLHPAVERLPVDWITDPPTFDADPLALA